MPNKRHTNSCDTTGQHHTQPLAKMQLSSCSTATTRCAFPSYRSQYTTPKFANEMHKLEAKPKRLQGFQDEFKAPQHTSQWQSPVASAPVQDQVKVWPSPIQSRLCARYPDHSYTWWPSTKKRCQEIQESSKLLTVISQPIALLTLLGWTPRTNKLSRLLSSEKTPKSEKTTLC